MGLDGRMLETGSGTEGQAGVKESGISRAIQKFSETERHRAGQINEV